MERVLVTGGAGYIGSVLVPALLARGHAVTVIDNFMYRQTSLLDCCADPDFTVIRGDVRDEGLMEREIARHDIVIPLAAIVGAPACDRQPDVATAINCEAIRHIARNLSARHKVVFPVTNSGYGIGDRDSCCTEESPLRPVMTTFAPSLRNALAIASPIPREDPATNATLS